MSSRFERVSRVEIKPIELHAYAKNIGILNRLSVGILKNFGRVLFVFSRVENLQRQRKHFYINIHIIPDFHHPSSTIEQPNDHVSSQHSNNNKGSRLFIDCHTIN